MDSPRIAVPCHIRLFTLPAAESMHNVHSFHALLTHFLNAHCSLNACICTLSRRNKWVIFSAQRVQLTILWTTNLPQNPVQTKNLPSQCGIGRVANWVLRNRSACHFMIIASLTISVNKCFHVSCSICIWETLCVDESLLWFVDFSNYFQNFLSEFH